MLPVILFTSVNERSADRGASVVEGAAVVGNSVVDASAVVDEVAGSEVDGADCVVGVAGVNVTDVGTVVVP
jgi:hypothetical protein